MPLADYGLDADSLREAIEPEQTTTDVRDVLGLPDGAPMVEDDEPSYAEIIAGGLEASRVDLDSPRAVALLDWAAQTDADADQANAQRQKGTN